MATAGDTIAIKKVPPPLSVAGRFNTIKFVFTMAVGTVLHTVRLYDPDGVLISELHDVESNKEYCIVTGEEVEVNKFYALPPAPVDSIDFLPGGEDNTTHGGAIIDILVGTRTTQLTSGQRYLVLQEVNDNRILGADGGYPSPLPGGNPVEWPRDPVTDMYLSLGEGEPPNAFDYIDRDNMFRSEALESNGELIPIIGNDVKGQKLNMGMISNEIFKKYSQGFR